MNKNLAYIVGVFLGDGTICSDNRTFNLQSIDKDFVMITAKCLKELSQNKVKTCVMNRKTRAQRKVYAVYLSDVEFCRKLNALTDDRQRLPVDIDKWDKEIQFELIAGLLDSEGYVSMSRIHVYNGRKVFDMKIGIGAVDIWIYELHDLLRRSRVKVGQVFREKIKSGKIFAKFVFNKKSFIENGLYFKIFRKQQRIENYKILFPGSTTIRGIPKTESTKKKMSSFSNKRKRDKGGRFM